MVELYNKKNVREKGLKCSRIAPELAKTLTGTGLEFIRYSLPYLEGHVLRVWYHACTGFPLKIRSTGPAEEM